MSTCVLTVSREKSLQKQNERCELQLHLLRSTCDDWSADQEAAERERVT